MSFNMWKKNPESLKNESKNSSALNGMLLLIFSILVPSINSRKKF